MTFDKIIDDGRLWAVRFDKDNQNALHKVLNQWRDAECPVGDPAFAAGCQGR